MELRKELKNAMVAGRKETGRNGRERADGRAGGRASRFCRKRNTTIRAPAYFEALIGEASLDRNEDGVGEKQRRVITIPQKVGSGVAVHR